MLYFTTLLCNMPGETRFGVFGCVLYLVGIVCPPFEISVAQEHGEKSDATRSELHRDVSVQIASINYVLRTRHAVDAIMNIFL